MRNGNVLWVLRDVSVNASRERERQRILQMAAENRKIAQRIESRQATVNSNRQAAASAAAAPQPTRRQGRAAPIAGAGAGSNPRPEWRDD